MFEMTADWWEIVVRVSLIYLLLLVMVRVTGKRQLGQLAPMEFLTILIVSETVSPSLTAEDTSVTAGLLAAATLFVWTMIFAVGTYRFHVFERLVEGSPSVLVRDGVIEKDVMRRERITDQELETALRQKGIASLSDVHLAVVETHGEITFIPAS